MQATKKLQSDMLKTLTGITMTPPSAFYVGLFTTDPTIEGLLTGEVSYSGYTRQPIQFSFQNTSSSTVGYVYNTYQITFPLIAAGSTGTVTHVGILDAETSGSMYLFAQLAEPVPLGDTARIFFNAQTLKWSLSGVFSSTYRQKFLQFFRNVATDGFTPYLALATASGSEKTQSGYTRQQMPMSYADTNGPLRVYNTDSLSFAETPTSWGTVGQVVIYDAATGGNKVAEYILSPTIDVPQGSVIRADAQAVMIRMQDSE